MTCAGTRAICYHHSMNETTHPTSNGPLLLEAREGGVLTLTMNRSADRNPLSEALIERLYACLSRTAADQTVKVVVLASLGPVFCAGHDLKEITVRRSDGDGGAAYFAGLMQRCSALMQAIVAQPQPVVAAVEGLATAAGCMLVASCDLAVAGTAARFCTPGVQIGLFCSTPMVALSRNLSPKHAMEMLLSAEPIGADSAFRFGLVNRIVEAGRALADAQEWAQAIAGKSPHALRVGKPAFYAQRSMSLAEAYAYAGPIMAANLLHAEACEGIAAVLDKRRPVWEPSDGA
jgi:enoyl-CoA hydratase/carnithine racemase